MDVKFGTSSLRGLAEDLAGITSALYVTAFCEFVKEKELIGDNREIFCSEPQVWTAGV